MTVDLSALDEILLRHEKSLAAITQNLVDLESDHTYALLRNNTFTGETAASCEIALDGLTGLWSLLQVYKSAVKKARECRDSIGLFTGDRANDLHLLLTSPHVIVETTTVPVLNRSLTGDTHRVVSSTLDGVLETMIDQFETGKSVVTRIGEIWANGSLRIDHARTELSRIELLSKNLSHQPETLASVRHACEELGSQLLEDPIGSNNKLSILEDRIETELQALLRLATLRTEVLSQFEALQSRLATVYRLAHEAEEAIGETRRTIADPIEFVNPPSIEQIERVPNGPLAWLGHLQALATEGQWVQVEKGLKNLSRLIGSFESAAKTARDTNSRLLRRRDELRGLFPALEAKASHLHGTDLPQVANALEAARAELGRVPFQISVAERAIDALTKAIQTPRSLTKEAR